MTKDQASRVRPGHQVLYEARRRTVSRVDHRGPYAPYFWLEEGEGRRSEGVSYESCALPPLRLDHER